MTRKLDIIQATNKTTKENDSKNNVSFFGKTIYTQTKSNTCFGSESIGLTNADRELISRHFC